MKQSTLEAKLRKYYKSGIPESEIVSYEPRFDRSRVISSGVVRHFLIPNPDKSNALENFLEEMRREVVRLLDNNYGYKSEYIIKLLLDDPEKYYTKYLHSSQQVVAISGENDKVYDRMLVGIEQNFQKLGKEKSGLIIDLIVHGEVTFSEIDVTGMGGHPVPLPKHLRVKGEIINIQNKGNDCFRWAITRSLNIEKTHNVRITPLLREKAKELDWSGISFPVSVKGEDIATFEKNNKIGVAIYAYGENDSGESIVYRQRCPQEKFGKVANIFHLKLPTSEDYDYHFCAVNSLSALLRRKLDRKNKVSYCTYCPAKFYNKIEMVGEEGQRRKGRRCVKLVSNFAKSMRKFALR